METGSNRLIRVVEYILDTTQHDSRCSELAAAQLAALGEEVVPLLCSFLVLRAQMVREYMDLEQELRNSRGVYTPKYRMLEAGFMERYHHNVDFEQMSELITGKGLWYNPVKVALKALELIRDKSCLGVLASLPFEDAKTTMAAIAALE